MYEFYITYWIDLIYNKYLKICNIIFIEKCVNTWRLCRDMHCFFQKIWNENNNNLFKKCEMTFIMSTLLYDFKNT